MKKMIIENTKVKAFKYQYFRNVNESKNNIPYIKYIFYKL